MHISPKQFLLDGCPAQLLVSGRSCIFYKQLTKPVLNKEGYNSLPAISLVLNGQQRIKTCDGDQLVIRQNELAFLPRDLYGFSDLMPETGSFESLVFFFEEELLREFASSVQHQAECLGKRGLAALKKITAADYIKGYASGLLNFFATATTSTPAFAKLKLLELLHLFHMDSSSEALVNCMAAAGNLKKRNLRSLMEENFTKPLKVRDYAHLSGRSLSSFRRDFRLYFKTTPQQWLKEKRLQKAHELLATLKVSVTQAAFEVGYENLSYFIKEFKKKYHRSPKQFILHRREVSALQDMTPEPVE